MSDNIKQAKRRRFVRYAIELEALLLINNTIYVQCFILDFCSGGFFLGFKEPPDIAIPLHKSVRIQLKIDLEHGQEKVVIDAQAMHIKPTGLGVSIENMPANVFNALTKMASAGSKLAPGMASNLAVDNRHQQSFDRAFKELLIGELPKLLGDFFETLSDNLAQSSQFATFFLNSSQFDDLISDIKLNREAFIGEFCNSVVAQVDYMYEVGHKNDQIIDPDIPLSLVEKDVFEDWLNISTVIRRVRNIFEDPLYQLTMELSRAAGISSGSINNPISPAVLCDSFRDLILQFNLNNNIKDAIYQCFEKTLIKTLGSLYHQVGLFLEKQESVKVVYPPLHGSKKTKAHSNNQNNEYLSDQQPVWFSPGKSLATPASVEPKVLAPITQVAGRLLDVLKENTANAPRSDNNISVAARTGQQNQPLFTSDEVLSAISQLQNSVGGESLRHFDKEALQKKLLDVLEKAGERSKSISNSDIQNIEVYGQFFETLLHDVELSSNISSYLESIYLPLLSLPLQGKDFLVSETHPARNIVNTLATLESAVKSNKIIKNINIKDGLDKIVSRIVAESNNNPNVFSEAEKELEGLAAQVTKSVDINIRRIVESYEGQQKLEIAKRTVQKEIDNRIAGRTVPTVIPELLKTGWQHLLVMAELNKQNDQQEQQKYFKILDDLIFWLYEQDSILKMQVSSIQKTIQTVEENLSSVCTNIFQRDGVIEELTALLIGEGTPKVRKRIKTVKIAAAQDEPKKEYAEIEEQWLAQVEQLGLGEWLATFSGSGEFEPMKLIWIGEVIEVYVFVNRDGINKLELTKEMLAELFRSGTANKIENLDTPLMDRATNLMLQKMHEKLIYNAIHDQETGLFTKDELVKQLKNELKNLGDSPHTLCHVEILDFRTMANICGLEGSKHLLKTVLQLIGEQLKAEDVFARLGDESFAILLKECASEEAFELSKKLVKNIADSHFEWQENSLPISISIGLVPLLDNCYDVHQLLGRADSASISAERYEESRVLVFTPDNENLQRQYKLYEWIGHIDKVLAGERLFLRCQMIAPVEQNIENHLHYEILLGIRDEDGGIVPPDHFIPAVEHTKRMPEIDKWVIKNVFDWIEKNRDYFDNMDGFSINLSGQSVNNQEFLEFLKAFLEASDLPLDKLTFEITETVAAENVAFTKRFMKAIRQYGCKFSLDDFGSGYSSYSYLKNLEIDYLKIDGAFVKDIANNPADKAIVKSMNEIAHSLGLKTIAEYVENNEIREILKQIGVDYVQGFGIHKPMPLVDLVVELPETKSELFSFEDTDFWGF